MHTKKKKKNRRHKFVKCICIVPPKITPFGFARDVNVGDRISVQCVVGTGDLPLTFTWLKDGAQIITTGSIDSSNNLRTGHDYKTYGSISNINDRRYDDSSIAIRQYDDFTSSLSITSVTRSQAGNYVCKVQNDASIVEHSSQLRVNGKIIK